MIKFNIACEEKGKRKQMKQKGKIRNGHGNNGDWKEKELQD